MTKAHDIYSGLGAAATLPASATTTGLYGCIWDVYSDVYVVICT